MAKVCALTGKRTRTGNNVSHAHNKTKRRFKPNLVSRRVWNPTKKHWERMRISTKALKTLDKKTMIKLT